MGGRRLSGVSNLEGAGRRMNGFFSRRAVVFAVLGFLALAGAMILASIPTGRAAAAMPPDIRATLSGAQLDDRISYTLVMENVGGLPATGVTTSAFLPPGLALADGTGTQWSATLPGPL